MDFRGHCLHSPSEFYPGDDHLIKSLLGVLIPRCEIEKQIRDMAVEIVGDYEGREIQPVVIMEGASHFYDILKSQVDGKVEVRPPVLLEAKSYNGAQSGNLTIKLHSQSPCSLEAVRLEDTLIIEDIEDTQTTLNGLMLELQSHFPTSLHVAVLLRKSGGIKKVGLPNGFVRYCGFEIANQFVVGVGLDYEGQFRNLDHVCVLNQSVYTKGRIPQARQ